MLNYIWAFMMIAGLLVAGLLGNIGGDQGVVQQIFIAVKKAVMDLALPLAGMMMFWLGVVRLMEKAGLLEAVAKFCAPVLRRLFPDVPADHPAMSAMVMNWCANMLGLANAATPLGLKAMSQLQEINPHKQSASNAMVTFLALNTGAFTLIPMTAMNFLNASGLKNAHNIILPTILATTCASIAAVIAARSFQTLPKFAQKPDDDAAETKNEAAAPTASAAISPSARLWLCALAIGLAGIAVLEFSPAATRASVLRATGISSAVEHAKERAANSAAAVTAAKSDEPATPAGPPAWRRVMDGASALAIPVVLLVAISVALARRVKVYEEFIEGAKEGFNVACRIMPFLVAMLGMLAVFRYSGALLLLESGLAPLLNFVGFPVELLSLGLMRPLSGSGAQGILVDLLNRPDLTAQIKYTAAIMYGSTETTFYVLAVYFGSVGVKKIRHALLAGLTADFVGMVASVVFGKLLF